MEWISFARIIIGGLIGGLFTYIGIKLTLSYNMEKESRERKAKKRDDVKRSI